MAERILRSRALHVARKKLPILRTKRLIGNLAWAAENTADAYRIGAEEAQEIIVERLACLKGDET